MYIILYIAHAYGAIEQPAHCAHARAPVRVVIERTRKRELPQRTIIYKLIPIQLTRALTLVQQTAVYV